VRELRNAWQRLADTGAEKSGSLERESATRPWTLTVMRGRNVDTARPLYQPIVRSAAKGPAWFRAMDRNGDGDVSRREWLGTAEEFRRLDKDGDGLISAKEAEAAERDAPRKR
jgi:hypothetical protein